VRELSLHLLDIVENSISAKAKNIHISVEEDLINDRLKMTIVDDGKGMSKEMVDKVIDPFVTSRTTRKVGLGIPLLKEAAEACKGSLTIESQVGKGTELRVDFQRSNIDRMPLGNLTDTIINLVIANPSVNIMFKYIVNDEMFFYDDKKVKDELKDVSLSDPLVLSFLREYIENGIRNIQPTN
jgi:anti-sigma regulatory factor (Ser/Thr protein kinase)